MSTASYRGLDPAVRDWAAQVERQLADLEARIERANLRDALQHIQALPGGQLPIPPPEGSALVVLADVGQPPALLYSHAGSWYKPGSASVYSPPGW